MERIESFRIDHEHLLAGVYVSRVDHVGDQTVTTYDLRLRRPYLDTPLSGAEAHTLEHLGATWLRNNPDIKTRVIYFGPMGCLTGFYMILAGEPDAKEAAEIARGMFSFIADYEGAIPGATRIECGNCDFQDLESARASARLYHDEVLLNITPERLSYPSTSEN
ncbi:MAG: S-ribosylhomocysteine lyase [Bacteroides sp.]|nr:S-ribosylhomocysteine lyase [Bacteroides sp.]